MRNFILEKPILRKYIKELFNKHAENTEFNDIENPLHKDREICGLLYLRKLVNTDLNCIYQKTAI